MVGKGFGTGTFWETGQSAAGDQNQGCTQTPETRSGFRNPKKYTYINK